jgi:tRNA(His) 5'-end guanylyltransferase
MSRFDDLDARLRQYETAFDVCVLPELWMVARIDGRHFTRLTKSTGQFEASFDERFKALMQGTTQHLMNCGFPVRYAYQQSDEISLLFPQDIQVFGRKTRKYESVLAGEASAWMSLHLGELAAFDCRISQLPNLGLVEDYFVWRQEDAHRNALNAHCYWMLRGQGHSAVQATQQLKSMLTQDKHELLYQHSGLNFNDVPLWQKRGTGFYYDVVEKVGMNPKTQETRLTTRRTLVVDEALPFHEEYRRWLREQLLPTP